MNAKGSKLPVQKKMPSWVAGGRVFEIYASPSGKIGTARVKDALLIDRLLRDDVITEDHHRAAKQFIRRVHSLMGIRVHPDRMVFVDPSFTQAAYHAKMLRLIASAMDLSAMDWWHARMVFAVCVAEIAPYKICLEEKRDRHLWKKYVRESFDSLCDVFHLSETAKNTMVNHHGG